MNRIASALVLATTALLWAISPLHAAGRDDVFRNPNPDRTWTNKVGGYFSRAKNYAVVISISDYIGTAKGGFKQLSTHRDAEKMKNFLLNEAGFDYVRVITDEKVTKATIEQLMTDEMRAMVGPNDRFIFYWSGHGTQLVRSDTNRAFGFLPLYDSKANAYSSMVSMQDISRWNSYLSARHALFILDACLSGLAGVDKKAAAIDTRLDQLSQPARYLIAAGTDKEDAIADQRWGGSLFTEAFIHAARGAGSADEIISIYKLIDRIQDRVVIEKLNAGWQKGLTPQIHDLVGSDGAFYFVAKGSSPAAAPSGPIAPAVVSPSIAAAPPESKDGPVSSQGGSVSEISSLLRSPALPDLPALFGSAPTSPGVQPLPQQPPPISPPTAVPAPRINPSAVPQLRWKVQSGFPSTTPTSLPLFASRLGALSGQRFKADTLPSGAVVPSFQLLDAVAQSVLDAAFAPGHYFVGKDRAFALMAAIPFGFTPREQLAFRRRADVTAIFDRLTAQYGVVARPCGLFGRGGELWTKKQIATRSDLAGLKVRVGTPFGREIYGELGGQAMLMPPGDIYPALERGVIDGVQFGTPSEDWVMGLGREAKNYYYPGSLQPGLAVDLFVARKAWDALPPAGRQVIEQACNDAVEAMIGDYERSDQEALAKLAQQGVTVARLPATLERELYEASERVLTKFARENPVIRDIMAIVDQMRASTVAAQVR